MATAENALTVAAPTRGRGRLPCNPKLNHAENRICKSEFYHAPGVVEGRRVGNEDGCWVLVLRSWFVVKMEGKRLVRR